MRHDQHGCLAVSYLIRGGATCPISCEKRAAAEQSSSGRGGVAPGLGFFFGGSKHSQYCLIVIIYSSPMTSSRMSRRVEEETMRPSLPRRRPLPRRKHDGAVVMIAGDRAPLGRTIERSDLDRRPQNSRTGIASGWVTLQLLGETLLLICCRCSQMKYSIQFIIADCGFDDWQGGMLFAMIRREGMTRVRTMGTNDGAPAR
jgi:hypothetical protein